MLNFILLPKSYSKTIFKIFLFIAKYVNYTLVQTASYAKLLQATSGYHNTISAFALFYQV